MSYLANKLSWPQIVDKTYNKVARMVGKEKAFKQWMTEKESLGYMFDAYMYAACFKISEQIKKAQDYYTVIVGKEGSGKTTLATQMASIVDPTFTPERIHFRGHNFLKALLVSKTKQAQIIDEGGLSFFSRDTMTLGNKSLVQALMTTRIKQQFVTVCIPDYGSLDPYLRKHRLSLLIRTLPHFHYQACFGGALNKINMDWQKVKDLKAITIPSQFFWHGYFNNTMGNIDPAEYNAKKMIHVDTVLKEMIKKSDNEITDTRVLLVPLKKAAQQLSIPYVTFYSLVRQGRIRSVHVGKKIGIPMEEIKKIMKEGVVLEKKVNTAHMIE